uniref:Calmodulin-lysine N-methyltransferase n=1 Tax=Arundo donax TaxID=35708 RepID=A0A0A8YD64_ARUDO
MILHWDKEQASGILNTFDIIVASDCTFFKQFHQSLARVVKSLLKYSATSQAIFLSPKRGDSLGKFLEIIKENGLCCELIENYDPIVWSLHKKYLAGDDRTWPNYDEEHCYPLLLRISYFIE